MGVCDYWVSSIDPSTEIVLKINLFWSNQMKKLKEWFEKQPAYAFVLLGLGCFGVLFFIGVLFVRFVHAMIPIYGILVPLGLFFIIFCFLEASKETKEKMAKWKEDNPYNYEYYEKKDKEP